MTTFADNASAKPPRDDRIAENGAVARAVGLVAALLAFVAMDFLFDAVLAVRIMSALIGFAWGHAITTWVLECAPGDAEARNEASSHSLNA